MIRVGADVMVEYISDIGNLSACLPTVKHAGSQGEDRVRLDVEVQGHKHSADRYLRADHAKRRLESWNGVVIQTITVAG